MFKTLVRLVVGITLYSLVQEYRAILEMLRDYVELTNMLEHKLVDLKEDKNLLKMQVRDLQEQVGKLSGKIWDLGETTDKLKDLATQITELEANVGVLEAHYLPNLNKEN